MVLKRVVTIARLRSCFDFISPVYNKEYTYTIIREDTKLSRNHSIVVTQIYMTLLEHLICEGGTLSCSTLPVLPSQIRCCQTSQTLCITLYRERWLVQLKEKQYLLSPLWIARDTLSDNR